MSQSTQGLVRGPTPKQVTPAPALEMRALGSAPQNGIRISEAAFEYASEKLAKRGTPDAAIRLGVRGGACAGYAYVIQFEDDPARERDYVYEVGGVRFIVDKKSFVYLTGSLLDFEKTLMFQGFKFRNPQEASTCGCGHSFTVR